MKPDLYVMIIKNDLDEMMCVTFLDDDPTDAQDKIKRYAKQLNGAIMKQDRVPNNDSKTIRVAYRRPKKQNKP